MGLELRDWIISLGFFDKPGRLWCENLYIHMPHNIVLPVLCALAVGDLLHKTGWKLIQFCSGRGQPKLVVCCWEGCSQIGCHWWQGWVPQVAKSRPNAHNPKQPSNKRICYISIYHEHYGMVSSVFVLVRSYMNITNLVIRYYHRKMDWLSDLKRY